MMRFYTEQHRFYCGVSRYTIRVCPEKIGSFLFRGCFWLYNRMNDLLDKQIRLNETAKAESRGRSLPWKPVQAW
jgi:hypothetical protein